MRFRSAIAGRIARPEGLERRRVLLRLAFKMAFVGGIVAACSPATFHQALVEHFSESTVRLPAWAVIAHALDEGPIEGDARYRGIGRRCPNFETRFRLEGTEGNHGAGLRYSVIHDGPFVQAYDFVTRHPMFALDDSNVFDEATWFRRPDNLERWQAFVVSSPQGDLRALRKNPAATAEKLAISGSLDDAFARIADGKYPRQFITTGLRARGQPCAYRVDLTPEASRFGADADLWHPWNDGEPVFLDSWRAHADEAASTDPETPDQAGLSTAGSGPRTLAAYLDDRGLRAAPIDPELAKLVDDFIADLPQGGRILGFNADPRGDVVVCETGMPAPPGAGNDLAWIAGFQGDDGRQGTLVGTWNDLQASFDENFSSAIASVGLRPGMDPLVMQAQVHDGEVATGRLDAVGAVVPGTDGDVVVMDNSVRFRLPPGADEPSATFVQSAQTSSGTSDRLCDAVPLLDNMADLPLAAPGDNADEACVPSSTRLCLQGNRFTSEIDWRDFADMTGSGTAIATEDPTIGLFFGPDQDWEMQVKVLNGCGFNDHFWVFASATTNVEYTLVVTDTASGTAHIYENPLGQASPAVVDTMAFATCP